MDLNPQRVRNADFKTVKRGLDPDDVRRFLAEVADELESAQNQSTAMEARARAAVARLQELSDGAVTQAAATSDDGAAASVEQAETISRTLLLAQRTADTTIAQAEAESERLISAAREEAASTLDSTREMAARLMDEARDEARKVGESERVAIASEVSSLKARRDFLESDVDHLEQFLVAQRARLRDAAAAMVELTERVPGGLGEVHRPLLSAADDVPADELDAGAAAEPADSDASDDAEPEAAAADPDDEPTADAVADADADHDEAEADAGDPADPTDDQPFGIAEVAADPDQAEGAAEPGQFDIEELAPDEADEPFGIADASGEIGRAGDREEMRFTFDDRR